LGGQLAVSPHVPKQRYYAKHLSQEPVVVVAAGSFAIGGCALRSVDASDKQFWHHHAWNYLLSPGRLPTSCWTGIAEKVARMNALEILALLFPVIGATIVLATGFIEVWLDERADRRKAQQAPGVR